MLKSKQLKKKVKLLLRSFFICIAYGCFKEINKQLTSNITLPILGACPFNFIFF